MYQLVVKHTFLQYDFIDQISHHRSKSAPAVLISSADGPDSIMIHRRKRKNKRSAQREKAIKQDTRVFQDFAVCLQQERWQELCRKILIRSDRNRSRWKNLASVILQQFRQQVFEMKLESRTFMHILQFAMRPLDLMQFYKFNILRNQGKGVEVWCSGLQKRALKVESLLRACSYFATLAHRCEIMLHLPDKQMILLEWQFEFPIAAVQGKVLFECGIPPECQQLRCLGKELTQATIGRSGVIPGDVIDIIHTDA